ncbi:hypothetical protein Pla100_33360 [Neorhodopirellula pilleata]|uniref:Uncharacterized protein n=1 Tax=Neorhodopirellula pilleata TaxID=2714738 RepID=A0A5C6A717_9BACT|nr:hypothetical protein Pla100_33360 [Neorhodopirellula pilleata]
MLGGLTDTNGGLRSYCNKTNVRFVFAARFMNVYPVSVKLAIQWQVDR